jgi:hypothetical protein
MDGGDESSSVSRSRAVPGPDKARQKSGAARNYLNAFVRGRLDNDDTIEAFALAGLREELVAALSLLCRAPHPMVERLLSQPGCEPVHLLARAAGLGWRPAQAILHMRAGHDAITTEEVEQGRAHFDRLTPQAARRFLQFLRHRTGATQ